MSSDANPDWWKDLFDEIYLATDARSVCDDDVTRREIDLLRELIPLSPEDEILDLCGGQGRHSIELYRRGFRNCTVVDYSRFLIDRGGAEADRRRMKIRFLRRDARKTGLPTESFDRVLILGNSLGYLPSPDGDREILAEAKRLLKSRGWILLDVVNGARLKRGFSPTAWHEAKEELVVCRSRKMEGDVVRSREMVLSKKSGLVRDRRYSLRIYEPGSMRLLLSGLGFTRVRIIRDFSPFRRMGDYGFMNFRMVVTAQRT